MFEDARRSANLRGGGKVAAMACARLEGDANTGAAATQLPSAVAAADAATGGEATKRRNRVRRVN